MEAVERDRRAEHDALLSVVVAGTARRGAVTELLRERWGWEPMPFVAALDELAGARVHRDSAYPAMVFKALANVARRAPGLLDDEAVSAALGRLHEALAREVGHPEPERAAGELRGALDRLVELERPPATADADSEPAPPPPGPPGGPTPGADDDLPEPPPPPDPDGLPSAVGEYQATAAAVLAVPVETVQPPECQDTAASAAGGAHCNELHWTIDKPLESVLPWTDPVNWPRCDRFVFFKDMVPRFREAGKDPGEWRGEYVEHVEIVAGYPIRTALAFTHREKQGGPGSGVQRTWTTYRLADKPEPDLQFLRDDGVLFAERRTDPTGATRTHAWCTKNYRFTDPAFDAWAELACDTFYGEIAIAMQDECAKGFAPQNLSPAGGPMPPQDNVPDDIPGIVDHYVKAAQSSLAVYAQLAKNAGARLTDAQPAPATTWADDLGKLWANAAKDALNAALMGQKFLASATKKP